MAAMHVEDLGKVVGQPELRGRGIASQDDRLATGNPTELESGCGPGRCGAPSGLLRGGGPRE